MIEAFLIAALSLPCLPTNKGRDCMILLEFLETRYPKYEFAFVSEDERFLNVEREWTPISVNGQRLWALRRGA